MNWGKSWALEVGRTILSILEILQLFVIVTTSIVSSNIVKIIVKLQYGNKYHIMNSLDSYWQSSMLKDKSVINFVFEVDSEKYDLENCDTTLLSDIKGVFSKFLKENSTGTVKKLVQLVVQKYGFRFWKQQDAFKIDDYIKRLDISMNNPNEEDMQDIFTTLSHSSLPYNHTATWEMYVCDKTVKKKNIETGSSSNSKTFFILFRVHHCVGDAMSIFKILQQCILEVDLTNEKTIPTKKINWTVPKYLRVTRDFTKNFFIDKLTSFKKNSLHIRESSGQKNLAWINDQPDIFPILKEIRNKEPKYSIAKILCASCSLAFSKYIQKNSEGKKYPDNIKVAYVKRISNNGFRYSNIPMELVNRSTFYNYCLKNVYDKIQYKSVVDEICQFVNEEEHQEFFEFTIFFMKLCIMPIFVLDVVIHFFLQNFTFILSNLPGFPKATFCGRTLKDLVFFAPNCNFIGVSLTIFSYDGELKFGLNVDKAIIKTREETKELLESIVKEIRNIHKSICL